ncbi:MAG: cation:proton antiporter [Gaiellaceae bacterium]
MPIPAPAIFLVVAAVASDLVPSLAPSFSSVELVVTVALVVILFDGGADIGWRRFKVAAVPIGSLGVIGTFATAGLITVFAHLVLGTGWLTSGLLGAAIAPTDPAVVFSVLGGHSIRGRTRTILEGESGANDPVGIALMLGLIELATHADASFWIVVRVFGLQMVVGLALGLAGGLIERRLLRAGWLRTLVLVAVVYLAAVLAHGSGFLAVFVMGLVVGDIEAPSQALQDRVASVAEVVAFVALGLTVHISGIPLDRWGEGLALAAFLAFVARPLIAGALLAPVRLDHGERLFVIWAGLKGAVPILLAAFTVTHHVNDAMRIYETVFVVVLASVVVQGGTIPAAVRRLGVRAA